MPSKKILLLSVSAGAGHTRAAEAIRTALDMTDTTISITHWDAMQYATAGLRKLYTNWYISLIKHAPSIWGWVYDATNKANSHGLTQNTRRRLERLNAARLLKKVATFQPDAIICTHFLPAELISQSLAKNELHCPLWVQVTDFDLHQSWVHPHVTGYFAANDEVAYRLREQGIADAAIHVTGIPISTAFSQALDRATCAAELGMNPTKKTLLLMGGGAGVGSLDAIAESLLQLPDDFQLVALAGKNIDTLTALQQLAQAHPQRLFPLGFTTQVERLMACADIAITKPGGLTTSECLAMGLPMIVNAAIPGQEERNAEFLLEQGVALTAYDASSLRYRVQHLLRHPEQLSAMRDKALALSTAHAANNVLSIVLKEIK